MAEQRIVVGYVESPAGSAERHLVRVVVREIREDAHIKTARLNLTVEKARELVAQLQTLLKTKPPA